MLEIANITVPASQAKLNGQAEIETVARELEATFLSEMLKSAGFGKQRDAFGGGSGEEHFSSFLVQAQADAMVEAGGLGLTEAFVKAMMEAEDD